LLANGIRSFQAAAEEEEEEEEGRRVGAAGGGDAGWQPFEGSCESSKQLQRKASFS
jgi:hypothetical protein